MNITELAPQNVWRYFSLICSVPHPSHHERALAEKILSIGLAAGLKGEIDESGNVYLDREATVGFENAPKIVLQGHLDMVPQAAGGVDFDFLTQCVTPVIDGDWVSTQNHATTLGADCGIGVSMILTTLTDENYRGPALRGIFTVSEEVGLLGAVAMSPSWVDGFKYLLNLDCESDLCIGSAGGCRQNFNNPVYREVVSGGQAFKISISGMKGGHSGEQIDKKRGNALIFMARLLKEIPCQVAYFDGGDVDNAIPRKAEAIVVCNADEKKLQAVADTLSLKLKEGLDVDDDFGFVMTPTTMPKDAWRADFQEKILTAIATVPNECFSFDDELHVVGSSSNFASFHERDGVARITTSQRCSRNNSKISAKEIVAKHFAKFGIVGEINSPYPAWEPKSGSKLPQLATAVWEREIGTPQHLVVLQGGTETGVLTQKNPQMEALGFGPDMLDIHTPMERVNIASVAMTMKFLQALISKLAHQA